MPSDNAIYTATHVNDVNITAIDLVNSLLFCILIKEFLQVPRAIEVAREKAKKN